jgi:hypothetical protein
MMLRLEKYTAKSGDQPVSAKRQAPGTTTLELGTLCAALPTRIEAPHFLRVLPWVRGLCYNVPGARRSARSPTRFAPRTLGYPSAYPTNVAPARSLVPCCVLSAKRQALGFRNSVHFVAWCNIR